MKALAYVATGLTLAAAWLGAWVAARNGHAADVAAEASLSNVPRREP